MLGRVVRGGDGVEGGDRKGEAMKGLVGGCADEAVLKTQGWSEWLGSLWLEAVPCVVVPCVVILCVVVLWWLGLLCCVFVLWWALSGCSLDLRIWRREAP